MNEQLLELERQFQNKQITEEQYQAERSRLERESLFLGDFDNEIKLSPLGNTPVGLSPSPEISNSSAEYYRTFPNALSNILQYRGQSESAPPQQGGFTQEQLKAQEAESILFAPTESQLKAQSNTTINTGNQEPSTFFRADYNKDNIPDYLQSNDFGNTEQMLKKRSDFNNDQEYYDYLKSTGVSDENISELGLKVGNTNIMDEFNKYLPFMNPYGSNIETELYSLGRFAGMDKGTQGRNLGIASSALSAGLGGARTLLSGLAQQKQTELSAEEIRRQLAQKNYTQQVQYMNQNSRGVTNG